MPLTSPVSDRWSAKILNERGLSLMPRRIGKDAPRGRHRPPSPAGVNATAWPAAHGSRPASVRRSAACDSQHLRLSHRPQYRSDALTRWSSACARFEGSTRFGMPVTPRHSRWLRSARVNRRSARLQDARRSSVVASRSGRSARHALPRDRSRPLLPQTGSSAAGPARPWP